MTDTPRNSPGPPAEAAPEAAPSPPAEAAPTPPPTVRPGRRLARGLWLALRLAAIGAGLCWGLEAYQAGTLPGLLLQAVLGLAVLAILARIAGALRKSLEYGLVTEPRARRLRPYWLQFLNRAALWAVLGLALHLSLPAAAFRPSELPGVRMLTWGAVDLLILCELVPFRRLWALPNLVMLSAWALLGVEALRITAPPPAEAVILESPFRGSWIVLQGGRSPLVNHHYPRPGQRHALDLVTAHPGPPPEADAHRLEAYGAFGEPLLAPAAGRIAAVEGDLPDNPIGRTDVEHLAGNHVVIEIGPERYVLLAHLQQGSVRVRRGQRVRSGQVVGRCGNSGNTSQPHLHLQVQSHPRPDEPGLRTFPIQFRGVMTVRDGRAITTGTPEPRRNDRLVAAPGR